MTEINDKYKAYFDILEIDIVPDVEITPDLITWSYSKLIKLYGSDSMVTEPIEDEFSDEERQAILQQIENAYQILSNEWMPTQIPPNYKPQEEHVEIPQIETSTSNQVETEEPLATEPGSETYPPQEEKETPWVSPTKEEQIEPLVVYKSEVSAAHEIEFDEEELDKLAEEEAGNMDDLMVEITPHSNKTDTTEKTLENDWEENITSDIEPEPEEKEAAFSPQSWFQEIDRETDSLVTQEKETQEKEIFPPEKGVPTEEAPNEIYSPVSETEPLREIQENQYQPHEINDETEYDLEARQQSPEPIPTRESEIEDSDIETFPGHEITPETPELQPASEDESAMEELKEEYPPVAKPPIDTLEEQPIPVSETPIEAAEEESLLEAPVLEGERTLEISEGEFSPE